MRESASTETGDLIEPLRRMGLLKAGESARLTPLTGGAAFLGQEQMSWASYAVKTLAPKLGLKVKLVGGDTPLEQGATPAQDLAQKYVGDKSVFAILGPSTSGASPVSPRR